MKDTILFFLKTKTNRNSLMAVAGAIEKSSSLRGLPVKFVIDVDKIKPKRKTAVAFSLPEDLILQEHQSKL